MLFFFLSLRLVVEVVDLSLVCACKWCHGGREVLWYSVFCAVAVVLLPLLTE